MKIVDLKFVEDDLIGGLQRFMPEVGKFCENLQAKALGLAAAQAAKEEAKKTGTSGLGEVAKRSTTRAVSPKLTRPRPPRLPEPERIGSEIIAHPAPDNLNRVTLDMINKRQVERREDQRTQTLAKYDPSMLFELSETKGGRKIEDVRREVEAERVKDLAFNSSFVHEPPDFKKISAKIRVNASTILREDALYRKQQAKDAQILQNYEEELRDPVEYFAWQQELKERDAIMKLEQVAMRREQAKQSAEEAHAATLKQKQDNVAVATLIRDQSEAIKQKKELELEIQKLYNQEVVHRIVEVRDTAPRLAAEKVVAVRIEAGKKTREELDAARKVKEDEDRVDEERRADKIRQLRAVNIVHKENVKVFDPTKTGGLSLLDEMSYMEMKERMATERTRAEVVEMNKRQEIMEAKQKRAKDLEDRANSVMRARVVKADANKAYYQNKREAEAREVDAKEKAREVAAIVLNTELSRRREEKRREEATLKAEQERVMRQQQYLGAAMGLVEETREMQQQLAREREIKIQQHVGKEAAVLLEESSFKDRANRLTVVRQYKVEKSVADAEREALVTEGKRDAVSKIKAEVLRKKNLAKVSRHQHEVTRLALEVFNPYAAAISQESLEKVRAARTQRLVSSS